MGDLIPLEFDENARRLDGTAIGLAKINNKQTDYKKKTVTHRK